MRNSMRILVVVAMWIGLVGAGRPADADGFVLIRNAKASSSQLAKADVKALYTGKTKLFSGSAAVVVVRGEDDPVFGAFADAVLGVSAKTLLSKIKQEVFKGDMTKPLKAGSDDEVIAHVASGPGVIGVVSAAAAKALPASVAVIGIGG